jgi:CRISPR system Cascade subunit CasE
MSFDRLTTGSHIRFRLRCRPSKRVGERGREDFKKRRGLVAKDEILRWLSRKGDAGGFALCEAAFDRLYWYDSKRGINEKPLGAVIFDGLLRVTDPEKFREAVCNGIGPQKAFGFGLLSIAPAEAPL